MHVKTWLGHRDLRTTSRHIDHIEHKTLARFVLAPQGQEGR
jgi:hypothetical protein